MQALPLSSVLLMICAMCLIPAGDTAGKLLTGSIGAEPAFVAWSRFALGAILVMALLRTVPKLSLFMDWRIWLRGALITGGILSILTALRTEPIADVFGAFFVGPALSYILAVWLLGEPFDLRRAGLVVLGFIGVLCVVQPGFEMSYGLLFAVLAGCFYGAFLTASRWLAPVDTARQMLLTQLIIGAILLAPMGAPAIPVLDAQVVSLTMISAACSGLGNLLLLVAYGQAGATRLAPLVYTQLIAATIFGFWFFGTFPNTLALVGLCILVASGFATLALRR